MSLVLFGPTIMLLSAFAIALLFNDCYSIETAQQLVAVEFIVITRRLTVGCNLVFYFDQVFALFI